MYDVNDCPQLEARTISVQLNSARAAFVSNYYMATQHVGTEILCEAALCRSARIRISTKAHFSSNWTVLDIMDGISSINTLPGLFFGNFANAIPGLTGGGWGDNFLSSYIPDPSNPSSANQIYPSGQYTGDYGNQLELWNISEALITSRLTQLLNTYWMTTVGSALITGTDYTWRFIQENNVSSRKYGRSHTADSDTPMIVIPPASVSTPERKLHCNPWWLIVFTVITTISLISAIYGLALTTKTNTPRLSMNISSMLRDSQYSHFGSTGSYLDDCDRTFISKNTVVRMGDVAPESSKGHITLCTVDPTGSTNIIGKLEKNRLYE